MPRLVTVSPSLIMSACGFQAEHCVYLSLIISPCGFQAERCAYLSLIISPCGFQAERLSTSQELASPLRSNHNANIAVMSRLLSNTATVQSSALWISCSVPLVHQPGPCDASDGRCEAVMSRLLSNTATVQSSALWISSHGYCQTQQPCNQVLCGFQAERCILCVSIVSQTSTCSNFPNEMCVKQKLTRKLSANAPIQEQGTANCQPNVRFPLKTSRLGVQFKTFARKMRTSSDTHRFHPPYSRFCQYLLQRGRISPCANVRILKKHGGS